MILRCWVGNHPEYQTKYVVTPDGTMYALVVTDVAIATQFAGKYPLEVTENTTPDFPEPVFSVFDNV